MERSRTINNKFLNLGEENSDIKKQRKDITIAQTAEFWKPRKTRFWPKKNVHELRNSDQFFFSRQQVNQHFFIKSSVLNTLQTSIRSYKLFTSKFSNKPLQNLQPLWKEFYPFPSFQKKRNTNSSKY